jgi:hypothetical protein
MKPLHQRILTELQKFPDGRALYNHLMFAVWPPDKYPKAYRMGCNGGPPGVAWVFGRALREMQAANLIWRPNERRERYGQPDVKILVRREVRNG